MAPTGICLPIYVQQLLLSTWMQRIRRMCNQDFRQTGKA